MTMRKFHILMNFQIKKDIHHGENALLFPVYL